MNTTRAPLVSIATTLQRELQEHAVLLEGVLTPAESKQAQAFMHCPEDYFYVEQTANRSHTDHADSRIINLFNRSGQALEKGMSSLRQG